MEVELAKKIDDLEMHELIDLLTKLKTHDRETFTVLKEYVEDLI